MVKIKICGLRRSEDVNFINELKPDFAGFILSAGYRRSVDFESFVKMAANIDKSIKKVGVFVDEPYEYIEKYEKTQLLDIIQLHGNESVDFVKRTALPVIKVLRPEMFSKASEYEKFSDFLLFDTAAGSGKVFDWNLIPRTQKPFFLAGGISAENIPQAVEKCKPYAVDMSSSVETNGCKDYEKIKKAIQTVRNL